ncbi:hypothetical protein ACFPM0_30880 [Pseudonocardia sulfidoxydans]|uniref:hypothetical protein n=1 Tax=Pseudonocardia sulfidoxydans TaxID=54011 RepID=UPI00360E2CD5
MDAAPTRQLRELHHAFARTSRPDHLVAGTLRRDQQECCRRAAKQHSRRSRRAPADTRRRVSQHRHGGSAVAEQPAARPLIGKGARRRREARDGSVGERRIRRPDSSAQA